MSDHSGRSSRQPVACNMSLTQRLIWPSFPKPDGPRSLPVPRPGMPSVPAARRGRFGKWAGFAAMRRVIRGAGSAAPSAGNRPGTLSKSVSQSRRQSPLKSLGFDFVKKKRGPQESGILLRPHPGGKELGGKPPLRDSTQSQAAWAFQVIGLLAANKTVGSIRAAERQPPRRCCDLKARPVPKNNQGASLAATIPLAAL